MKENSFFFFQVSWNQCHFQQIQVKVCQLFATVIGWSLWKFEKKLTKIIVRLTREWKSFLGIFWIFLVIFGIFWKSVFQLRICQSDFTGWTHYSFRPFWAIQSWEKHFFSDFWRFLLNKEKFQKIHSFEFWITNYVPKVSRYHLEVDLEAIFVLKLGVGDASVLRNLTDRAYFSIYSREKAELQAWRPAIQLFRANIYDNFRWWLWRALAEADIGAGMLIKWHQRHL